MKTNLKVIATEVQAQVATKVKLVTDKFEASKLRLRSRVERKLEDVAVNVMGWMLGSPRVQRVIAKQLENNAGALCRTLENAIENHVDGANIEVDADNVRDLDNAIENALENFEVDADKVNGLDSEVQSIVEEMDISVKAENIDELEETVESILDDKVGDAVKQALESSSDELAREFGANEELIDMITQRVADELVRRLRG